MKFNKKFTIQEKTISEDSPTFIIAEAGINHNGELDIAYKMIEVAKKSGCRESELIFSGKPIPIEKIKGCKNIGLSSGASAPEELIQNFISEIKKHINVSVKEIITAREKVTFRLPRELN